MSILHHLLAPGSTVCEGSWKFSVEKIFLQRVYRDASLGLVCTYLYLA